MTNDQRFQALRRLGQEADAWHASEDDLERLPSASRKEMSDRSHWPYLYLFKSLARPSGDGKSVWEASAATVDVHQQYWEWTSAIYAEWKMIEDDDFWTAVHKAQAPPSPAGPR